jgi:cytochrome c-type biogenesis protein CcmF
MLLANNVLLIGAPGSVLLGTLYPLFLDALDLGKISVGPPYFDTVFVPAMTPLVFLMGIGPLARWKEGEAPGPWQRLRWALGVSVVTALCFRCRGSGGRRVASGCCSRRGSSRRRSSTFASAARRARRRSRAAGAGSRSSYWGMIVAHLGIAVFIIGVTMVKGYETERDLKMSVGDTVAIGGYTFRFDGTTPRRARTTAPSRASSTSPAAASTFTTLYPEKRSYNAGGMPMTGAAIRSMPDRRSLRVARRARRRRRVERADLSQAFVT